MCIIAAKPAGVTMPSTEKIENMWNRNSDGAGIMYAVDNKVHIEKGFMTYASFNTKLDELRGKYNLDKLPVVMHFRITTHGGTKPENCHPFPITDSVGMLRKLNQTAQIGVAHNGIIDIRPRKGISDTMEYIASQLAPLSKAVPNFYKNKHLMQMISNAIDSKMAFLTSGGKIYTIGDFVENGGVMYSNRSFERTTSWRDYYYGCYEADSWELYSGVPHYRYKPVMWLDDAKGEFIVTSDGDMLSGEYAIDADKNVYEYDYELDALVKVPALAYNSEAMLLNYDADSQLCVNELIATGDFLMPV